MTTPSEVQLDLAAGVRARLEGETADPGAQVLARMRLACRDPATGGAAPVRTVRPTCAVPLDIMDDCRRRCEPFPDPHDWRARADLGNGKWLWCARCGEWTRPDPMKKYETATERVTVRFTPSEVERIDAALAHLERNSSYRSRADRSEFIRCAVLQALLIGCPRACGRGAFPAEPANVGQSAGPTASDEPGMSDAAGGVGRSPAKGRP